MSKILEDSEAVAMLMTLGAPALAELQKKFKEQKVEPPKQVEFLLLVAASCAVAIEVPLVDATESFKTYYGKLEQQYGALLREQAKRLQNE